ncbi:hypothetical protein ECC18A13_008530 [Enterobacter sp. 18A13]|nr:hypothetical protein ECC18A13_008530 [Enterobacter sp. 18A13]
MNIAIKFAQECDAEYERYRSKCRSTVRGDGVHDLWVKLAWINRCDKRKWLREAA